MYCPDNYDFYKLHERQQFIYEQRESFSDYLGCDTNEIEFYEVLKIHEEDYVDERDGMYK